VTALAFEPVHLAIDEDLAQALGYKLRDVLRGLLETPTSAIPELPALRESVRVRAKKARVATKPAKVRATTTPPEMALYELSPAEVAAWNRERAEWRDAPEAAPPRWLDRPRARRWREEF
jgi:hypothetical protein